MVKLLVLSDIHGNWEALNAVLAAESGHEAVVFCGDVVDYGPAPMRCVYWLMGNAAHAVRGNHDHALAFDIDCRCSEAFRDYARATRAWHRTMLTRQEREFLGQLPTLHCFEWQGRRFRVAHATPDGDMYEYLPMDRWQDRAEGSDDDFILLGHTHVQGIRNADLRQDGRRQSRKRGASERLPGPGGVRRHRQRACGAETDPVRHRCDGRCAAQGSAAE